jgi:LPXTG-motif cell wall-anchored protein
MIMSADVFELILAGFVVALLLWIFWWRKKSE